MLRIRLTRTGKKHQPTYRIVVAEHSAPIKGKFIDILGYYLPTRTPKVLEVDGDKVKHWISVGAQATDTVHNLLVTKGILTTKRNIKYSRVKVKEEPKADAPKSPENKEEIKNENVAMTDESVDPKTTVETEVIDETPNIEPTVEEEKPTE